MKLSADAAGIEWNAAAFLSQDTIAIEEIKNGFDLHSDNQSRLELPDRRIAKILLFRIIYGGGAWAFANDPDFNWISREPDFWQERIDGIYAKYCGLAKWHTGLQNSVISNNGRYISPTGRSYLFERYRSRRGEWIWPHTTILNYPVQGLAADIMMLARISLFRRMKTKGYKSLLVNTIHDSIDIDSLPEEVYNISLDLKSVFEDLPSNFEKMFGVEYNLPLRCELKIDGVKQ
jgi:DNA polymerase-1